MLGTTEANGKWTIISIDGTHFDLQGSTFTNAYTSGGSAIRADTVTINHRVTVDSDRTIGHSPGNADATKAVSVGSAGSITVASGVRLTVRGDLEHANSSGLTLQAGAKLTFDATLAATPASTNYRHLAGNAYTVYSPLICNGTANSRCEVSTAAGCGQAYMPTPSRANGFVQADYCDWIRMGTATQYAIRVSGDGNRTLRLTRCTFDTCGGVSHDSLAATDSLQIDYCEWRNGVGTNDLISSSVTAPSTGSRLLRHNVFTRKLSHDFKSVTFEDNYIGGDFAVLSISATATPASWKDNFLRTAVPGDFILPPGTLDGNVLYSWQAYLSSQHGVRLGGVGDQEFKNGVIDGINTELTGDMLLFNNPSTPATCNVHHNLQLPNPDGSAFGTLVTMYSGANNTVVIQHNTYVMGTQGVSFAETYTGHAGMCDLRSNLAWNVSKGAYGWVAWDALAGETFDSVANYFSAIDYNGSYNASTTNQKVGTADAAALARGYLGGNATKPWASTPGAHDVTTNPQFVDATRCLATFDTDYLGNAAGPAWASGTSYTVGQIVSVQTAGKWNSKTVNVRCIAAHAALNGDASRGKPGTVTSWHTYWELAGEYRIRAAIPAGTTVTDANLGLTNASYINAYKAWVKAGFAPTNPDYRNAGHDGATIGAVEGVFASSRPPGYLTTRTSFPAFQAAYD